MSNATQTVDVPSILHELEGWFLKLKRATAGYGALHGSLMSSKGHTPEGERKKGLPVFEFSAPLIGNETRESVKVAIDLRKVHPQYLDHVLVPLITTQAEELLESIDEIEERIKMLRPILESMLTPAQPAAA